MNKVIEMGRLVADPELRYSAKDSSLAIVRYRIAVNRIFGKKDDKQDDADFFSVVAFGKAGEFASKYFKKGMRVMVEGRLQNNNYEKNNVKYITSQIIAERQEFADAPAPAVSKAEIEGATGISSIPDDELPFQN